MSIFSFKVKKHGQGVITSNENIVGDRNITCEVLSINNFSNGISFVTLNKSILDNNSNPNIFGIGEQVVGDNNGIAFVKNILSNNTLDLCNVKIDRNISVKVKSNNLNTATKKAEQFISTDSETLELI